MADWWPLDTHAVSVERQGTAAPGVIVEPRIGGAVIETRADGGTAVWGRVLAYDPPRRFAMTWHPGTDPDKSTRVEVAFDTRPGGGTRVTLTHSGWEVWATEAPDKRQNYLGGWDFVFLQRFGAACAAD